MCESVRRAVDSGARLLGCFSADVAPVSLSGPALQPQGLSPAPSRRVPGSLGSPADPIPGRGRVDRERGGPLVAVVLVVEGGAVSSGGGDAGRTSVPGGAAG